MYSRSDIAVDKGLGFDFSAITDLVKSALPVTLNIFQNQMKLNQVKAMGTPYGVNNPYGLPVQSLPAAQMYGMGPQPNIPGQYAYPASSGIDTTTMLAIGGAVVVGLLAFKLLK
jgi:hypothetical protein